MKNEKIIASWDKMLPDEAADKRMRSKIIEYQRSYIRKDRVISMTKTIKKLFPIAACFILVIAVTAFIGVQHNWFGAKNYTVTLDNGEKLVYGNGSPKGKADYGYNYEVKGRALTADELHILFPSVDITENKFPYATFKADTGEMLRLETIFDDIHVHLAKSGLPATDTIIVGKKAPPTSTALP